MSKNQEYALQYADYAMLCYFQHNIAYVEYKVMYSLLFILLVLNYLAVIYHPTLSRVGITYVYN